jgi:hypothetical protein
MLECLESNRAGISGPYFRLSEARVMVRDPTTRIPLPTRVMVYFNFLDLIDCVGVHNL